MVVRRPHLAGKNLRFSTIVNRQSQPNYLTKHLSFYAHKAFLKFIVRVLQSHKSSSAFLLRRLSPTPPKSALLYGEWRKHGENRWFGTSPRVAIVFNCVLGSFWTEEKFCEG